MKFLWFLLGLLVGVALWRWQRSQYSSKLKTLLRDVDSDILSSSLPSISQLTLAIAHHNREKEQLEQQLEIYKQVLHNAPTGYLEVDDENRLLWCNAKAREMLSMNYEPLSKPRLLLELVRSYELDHLIEQTREAGKPCQQDWTFYPVSADPSHLSRQEAFPLRGHGLPLPKNHVGIFLENRQEAVLLMQQRDRWASDVAHELKTPLTSIRLVAETLHPKLAPPLQGWVNRLISETIRLSNLVQDLLDLGQLERGSSNCLKLKTADLVELTHSAWINLEPLARKNHLQIHYEGPERLLLMIDEHRMYRVLVNLLDNSIKYSPPYQKICVRISIEPVTSLKVEGVTQQIRLEIIDAGPGFPEEALPYIFDRFYRADPSRSHSSNAVMSRNYDRPVDNSPDTYNLRDRNSSGLGLAIVKQIVEAHLGSVSASNHPETGGAWLQVCLPWHEPDASTPH